MFSVVHVELLFHLSKFVSCFFSKMVDLFSGTWRDDGQRVFLSVGIGCRVDQVNDVMIDGAVMCVWGRTLHRMPVAARGHSRPLIVLLQGADGLLKEQNTLSFLETEELQIIFLERDRESYKSNDF